MSSLTVGRQSSPPVNPPMLSSLLGGVNPPIMYAVMVTTHVPPVNPPHVTSNKWGG